MQQSNEYSTFPIDIEKLLADGNIIKIKPQGYSMYPLFIPGRDEACIEHVAFSSLKRDDVVLYRRDESILVLHRIWKITGDSFIWSVIIKHKLKDLCELTKYEENDWICSKRKIYQRSKSFISLFLLSLAIFTPDSATCLEAYETTS